jgi:hypothetical protein
MKSGNLNFLELSGPLQACNGTALTFTFLLVERTPYKVSLTLWNTCQNLSQITGPLGITCGDTQLVEYKQIHKLQIPFFINVQRFTKPIFPVVVAMKLRLEET